MSKVKFKYQQPVFPVGMAKYAWLHEPDRYQMEKHGKEQFSVRVLLNDTPEIRDLLENITALGVKEAKLSNVRLKSKYSSPWKFPEDLDSGDFEDKLDDSGHVVKKAKYDEDYRDKIFFSVKSRFKPGLIGREKDENGKLLPLADGVKIMSGDLIRVKAEVLPYDGLGSGLSLRLKTVQLVKKNNNFSGLNTEGFDDLDYEDDEDIPF